MMPRFSSKRTVLISCLVSLLIGTSCSRRQRLIRSVRAAETDLSAGDLNLRAGKLDEALASYQSGQARFAKIAPAQGQAGDPVVSKSKALANRLALRLKAFESPEGALEAMLRLSGSEEDASLGPVLWDLEFMARQALGDSQWAALSDAAQSNLDGLVQSALYAFLQGNRNIMAKAEMRFGQHEALPVGVRVEATMSFSGSEIQSWFDMKEDGPLWRVIDMRVSLAPVALSELLRQTFQDVQILRPLDEILQQPDREDVVIRAANLVLERMSSGPSDGQRMAVLVMNAEIETEDGRIMTVPVGRGVQYLGEKRMVNGVPQAKIRTFGELDKDAPKDAPRQASVGWIREDALNWTEEDEAWGIP